MILYQAKDNLFVTTKMWVEEKMCKTPVRNQIFLTSFLSLQLTYYL